MINDPYPDINPVPLENKTADLQRPQQKKISQPGKKVISFYNNHTGEFLKNCAFWENQKFCPEALKAINKLCRDHRTDLIKPIDPRLLLFLYTVLEKVETKKIVNVISGYRSEESNNYLCEKTAGVARNSYHKKGQAIDFYIHGISTRALFKAASSLKKGGVGGYNQFIHIDTGRVRRWGNLNV